MTSDAYRRYRRGEPMTMQMPTIPHSAPQEGEGEEDDLELLRRFILASVSDHVLTPKAEALRWEIANRFTSLRSRLTELEREKGELEEQANERIARIAVEAAGRVESLEADLRVARGDASHAEQRVRELEEDAKRLAGNWRGTLAKYGSHIASCRASLGGDRCNCGFTAYMIEATGACDRAIAARRQPGVTVVDEAHDG